MGRDRVFRQEQGGARIAACLGAVGDILPGFVASPQLNDRVFWSAVPKSLRDRLIADAEAFSLSPWAVLTASAYRAFRLNGNRVDYENVYFERRRRLNAFVLAEALEGQGRFLHLVIEGVLLICEESGWQLPAHNSYVRDTRAEPLPDPDRPVIDLFAAETGAQLAIIAQMLGDRLDAASPLVVQRIDREVERRITRPYLDQHFWWMGRGDEKMNNWTAWCTQNVLVATFCRPTDQKTRHAVLGKAAGSLDAFLKDYEDDGACDEGALYYRHAALCLFGALSVMDAVAPVAFSSLWQDDKIRNMAEFILHMHVEGDRYINFADASAVLEPCGAREFLFGKAVGSVPLMALAASDATGAARPDLPDDVSLFNRLMALVALPEMADLGVEPTKPADIYYPSCGLFIVRDAHFVLAAKAGDNDDGHNHNDVGSFIVYKNGRPLLIDVGVETYTAKTFSPQRYDIWTMQSGFHNLPGFDGVGQTAGAQFAARDVSVTLDGNAPQISMDIAGAYPAEAELGFYRRTIALEKGAGIRISDHYEGAKAATLSLMLAEEPTLSDGRIEIGTLGVVMLTGAGAMSVDTITITDPRLRKAWPERIFRVSVPLAEPRLDLWIE